MKKSIAILCAGLLLCVAAFCGFYFTGTASQREVLGSETPELAWLKKEFNIGDAEFSRITKLHDAYQPHCKDMCLRIDERGMKLKKLLSATNAMTPEIEAAFVESAKLRTDCHRDMLKHFFEVSRTMPPAQGKRYLEWISERTFAPAHGEMTTAGH